MQKVLICLCIVIAAGCSPREDENKATPTTETPPPPERPVAAPAAVRPPAVAEAPVTVTAAPSPVRPASKPRPSGPVSEVELRDYVKVPVFYGTTRKVAGNDRKNVYGGERGRLHYGLSWVSIPRSHEVGELEEPSLRTLTFREDPVKHVVLLEVRAIPKDQWFAHLNDSIVDGGANQAFVFIHGFNVRFAEASRRTAQIKYDLGFAGPAILFSWPSLGRETMYLADRESVDATVPVLARFLVDLRQQTGAAAIHIIAHSLGNRLLSRAMERIDLDNDIHPKPVFSQVLLAAPDIDAEVFRDDLVPRMRKLVRGITLYGASDDRAIQISKRVNAITRAGEGGAHLPIIDGVDSIDVTGIDVSFLRHSYVGRVSVLGDIAQLVCEGRAVGERLGIVRRDPAGWRMVADAGPRTPRPCRAAAPAK